MVNFEWAAADGKDQPVMILDDRFSALELRISWEALQNG
jgi:hypothetical protein